MEFQQKVSQSYLKEMRKKQKTLCRISVQQLYNNVQNKQNFMVFKYPNQKRNNQFNQIIQQNHNLIQKIIFFSTYSKNFIGESKRQSSKYMIILFSYKWIPKNIIRYWKYEEDLRKSIRSDVENIVEAPQPYEILWEKLENKHIFGVKCGMKVLVFMLTFVQLIYTAIICSFTIFIFKPSVFQFQNPYPQFQQFSTIIPCFFYSLILTLQQIFLKYIIKRISYLKQDLNTINYKKYENSLNFWLNMLNLIYLPIVLCFLCGIILRTEEKFYILILYSDVGLIHVFLFYFIMKCILFPIFEIFYLAFLKEKCMKNKCNSNNGKQFQQQKFHLFDQINSFKILFIVSIFYSIICTPIFLILYLLGSFLKLYYIITQGNLTFYINNFSIKTFIEFLQSQFTQMRYIIFIKCFFVTNCILIQFSVRNQIIENSLFISLIIIYIVFFLVDIIIIKYGVLWKIEKRQGSLFLTITSKLKIIFPKLSDKQKFNQNQQSRTQKNLPKQKQNTKDKVQRYIKQLKNFDQNQQQVHQDSQYRQIQKVQKKCFKKQQFQSHYDQFFQKVQNTFNQIPNNLFLNQDGEKNQVIEQLNTMSRSLEATLKEKLFRKPPDPLAHYSPRPQSQYDDFQFQQKVYMQKPKSKVKIPPLKNLQKIAKQSQKPKVNATLMIPQRRKKNKQVDSDISYELFSNETNKIQIKQVKKKQEIKLPLLDKKQKKKEQKYESRLNQRRQQKKQNQQNFQNLSQIQNKQRMQRKQKIQNKQKKQQIAQKIIKNNQNNNQNKKQKQELKKQKLQQKQKLPVHQILNKAQKLKKSSNRLSDQPQIKQSKKDTNDKNNVSRASKVQNILNKPPKLVEQKLKNIKLSNLFDSQQQSIKKIVRKKIKQSIKKIQY